MKLKHTGLTKEYEDMNAAVASAVQAWAELENALAHLLGTMLEQNSHEMGIAIYYAPNSAVVRLAIVHRALGHFMIVHHLEGGNVPPFWERLHKRIISCRRIRDEIIRGNVRIVLTGSGKQSVRLTAPMSNLGMYPLTQLTGQWAADQASPYGVKSIHDVNDGIRKFASVYEGVEKLRPVVSHLNRGVRDDEAYQRKCRELDEYLRSHPCDSASQEAGPASPSSLSAQ